MDNNATNVSFLRIVQWNARSLRSKRNQFELLLAQEKIHIALVSETWLEPDAQACPTAFSAGVDLLEMYKPDLKRFETLWTAAQDVWIKLFSANFITAAAINGHAPGGGYMLSACCEYRDMVSGKSTIGMLETSIGFIPPTWIINIMLYTIPKRHAEFALTSSRLFTVDEALKVGLIDETATDKVDAIEKCKQFIKKFDRIPPLARTITKQKIRDGPLKWMTENRSNDIQEFFTLINKPKVQEAIEVYIQKLKQKAAK